MLLNYFSLSLMARQNKLALFLGKFLRVSLKFASKAGAYLSGALWLSFCLKLDYPEKIYQRQIIWGVCDEEKKFIFTDNSLMCLFMKQITLRIFGVNLSIFIS